MRAITILQSARFAKQGEEFAAVPLPHTWNAQDGQDGGADYWRGKGVYEIDLPAPTPGMRQYIEFAGANHVAEVVCNGRSVGVHKGGFSTFRFALTDILQPSGNTLTVTVDNDSPAIYPQKADFTFFGGLYRPVSFIEVPAAHIALDKDGTQGVFVTPQADGKTRLDVFTTDAARCEVHILLRNAAGSLVANVSLPARPQVTAELLVTNPHLWNGRTDPYLYTAEAALEKDGEILDSVTVAYGYRSFTVNAEKGFFLNDAAYPLHGVSRHQDRADMGWAISEAEHKQDAELICEMGANAVRLAHYQHAQTFYDLCDQKGLVVWAEIPFISQFMPEAESCANAEQQLRELIAQSYNHPAVCFWGISNEITMTGEIDALYTELCKLNALAKQLDPSRLTTMAHLNTVPANHPHTTITDVQGFNVYKGWYIGEIADNGPYLDEMHAAQPTRPLALSEYGADADIRWHSAKPRNHDYTEEYQALYHEGLLKVFAARTYLWGTFVWNMFDFAADARNEGGVKGRNCKGLVTYDRREKKDAYYIYQAYWTSAPMVHICGKRFADRAPGERTIKVYTNCAVVTLTVNGVVVDTLPAQNHVCTFENVPMHSGENVIEVTADTVKDSGVFNAVEQHNTAYDVPPEESLAGNWFDEATGETMTMESPDGFLSIHSTIEDLLTHPEADPIIAEMQTTMGRPLPAGMSEAEIVARAKAGMQGIKFLTVEKMIQLTGAKISPQNLILLNRKLNAVKK